MAIPMRGEVEQCCIYTHSRVVAIAGFSNPCLHFVVHMSVSIRVDIALRYTNIEGQHQNGVQVESSFVKPKSSTSAISEIRAKANC